MPWPGLLAKLSPERVAPILREGQCKPVSDYDKPPNMLSDHHESSPGGPAVDEHDDESSSIGDSSLFAPPTSHRHLHPHPFPQSDPQGLHSFVEAHDPSLSLSATAAFGSTAAPPAPISAINYTEYSDGNSLPNPPPLSPHPSWLRGQRRTPPPLNTVLAPQSVVSPDGYAPIEDLPPQNYISTARTMPRLSMPFYPPTSQRASLLTLGTAPPTHGVSSPTAVVPPNSELARPPRFTFAPPGADVPADPVVSATGPSPTSGRRRDKEKAKGKFDKASQPVAEGSVRRARSNSWSVVSSVFRRKSGRQSGPPRLTTDGPPQLTPNDWRDLAKWAHRPCDDSWGENFEEYGHAGASFPPEPDTGQNPYERQRQLPPLPPHLSHLPAPAPTLLRTNSSTSALNPFLAHRPVGLPPLAWDLRASARAILFPSAAGGGPALPMAASDYAQPATWPPCGVLRIGAIGEHAGWRWPVEAHNPAGVRCGDVFRALVANLHEFVGPHEIARMPPERVVAVAAACAARVAVGMPPGSAVNDGIRRVDCLLGCTQFHGLEPGPSTGEWTMYVGAP